MRMNGRHPGRIAILAMVVCIWTLSGLRGSMGTAAAVEVTILTPVTLAAEGADKRVLVPTAAISDDWRGGKAFDDSKWTLCTGGPGGVGFDTASDYLPLITLDVRSQMYGSGKNNTCYIRIPFTVDANALVDLNDLTLKVRCDDGFVAYLNGQEIGRSNFAGISAWNSHADSAVEADGEDYDVAVDITAHKGLLKAGPNILAIQGMNSSATSSDFLISAALAASLGSVQDVPVSPGDSGGSTDRRLVMTVRDSYLPGIPVLVRVEVVRADGRVDRDLWDATATLTLDNPGVHALQTQITLYNGLGSSLVVFTGSGPFTLTAAVGGLSTSRWLADLSGQPQTRVSGTLAGDTVWSGIVHVIADVVVPAGRTLTVQPGTLVLLDGAASGSSGVDIDARGSLVSLGSASRPVTFTAADPAKAWGEIHHEGAAVSVYQYTDLTLAGRSPGAGHTGKGPAVRTAGSKIVFDRAALTDNVGKIMQSASGSDLTFRHCLFARSVMGPEITGTALLLEETWITEMLNPDDADGIYIHDQSAGQTCLIKGGVVARMEDDCIDTLGCELTIEDQILRGAKDKGLSIYGGKVTLRHCLIAENNRAPEDPTVATLAAKTLEGGSAEINIDRSTIVASKVQGTADIGIQSHNKYSVKAGKVTYNVTHSIIVATDPVSVQSPYQASDIHVSASDLFGEAWPGSGNLNADPLFVDSAHHDYRLKEASPCRAAGLGSQGEVIDLGCYPYVQPADVLPAVVWTADQGIQRITGERIVAAGTSLIIGPGTTVAFDKGARLTVRGQLVAAGTASQPIRFTRSSAAQGTWTGIQFANTKADNRLSWAILEYGRTHDGMVGLDQSVLQIDHVTFDHTDLRRIRTQGSSLVVRDCVFTDLFDANQAPTTDNMSEHIWGVVAAGGRLLIERNTFGRPKGHNDCVDVDGPSRPDGIIEIRDNVFLGGGDDALDLEGDAHVEGNRFMHFLKDKYNTATGNSNFISAGAGKNYVVVRNVFYDGGHVAQVKDGAFMTFVNNTVVQIAASAFYFEMPGRTLKSGKGALVDGCIFWQTVEPLFEHTDKTTQWAVHRSILPSLWHSLGAGNLDADPLLAGPSSEWRLLPGSLACGTGPWGLDRGAYVPAGAAIQGEPGAATTQTTATLTVGGPGITAYRYSVNASDGPWSEERAVDSPLALSGLQKGQALIVYVQGMDSAGQWQILPSQSQAWTLR